MKTLNIVIPCFNEEESIPQLIEKLKELSALLGKKYETTFIFVDDGSTDNTNLLLQQNQTSFSSSLVLKHDVNRNLGAALKTGIEASHKCDLLAFLDSDCTYEPAVLLELLQEIENGADLATVSPYHPMGKVEGVPEWRLLLSKSLSLMYRIILGTKFYTYTAMVRVVKTDLVRPIMSARNDYSFVAAVFINAIRKKYRIVEVPTILKVRKFGVSKINIIKTIKSHLVIIFHLLRGMEI
jgi:dolichol-phosphate mannosyltransferase